MAASTASRCPTTANSPTPAESTAVPATGRPGWRATTGAGSSAAGHDPLTSRPNGLPTAGTVTAYDAKAGTELARFAFPAATMPAEKAGGPTPIVGTTGFPLAVACSADGSRVYVTAERDDTVTVLDASATGIFRLVTTIHAGARPVALLMDEPRHRLYVANAGGDTISAVDTTTNAVVATVLLRPEICRDLPGVTPVGLCLSPDGGTLYAACADLNAVAVIDTGTNALQGYAPAGWYPAAVAVAPDGRLLVCNAKGVDARHPNPPVEAKDKTRQLSPLRIVEGRVVSQPAPTAAALPTLTARALENARLTTRFVAAENPLKGIDLAAPGGLRHVIYIVKENRTYDQVLGDDKRGDGDPDRVLFGKRVTPNLHAIAERFVLLDNFYVCGEVSGDGWPWSTQGMANEYVARYVPYLYSKRGEFFNTEGSNDGYLTGGFPATGPDGRPLSDSAVFKNGAPGRPGHRRGRRRPHMGRRPPGRAVLPQLRLPLLQPRGQGRPAGHARQLPRQRRPRPRRPRPRRRQRRRLPRLRPRLRRLRRPPHGRRCDQERRLPLAIQDVRQPRRPQPVRRVGLGV